jgi:hypothetical protein
MFTRLPGSDQLLSAYRTAVAIAFISFLSAAGAQQPLAAGQNQPMNQVRTVANYGALPLAFEANQGRSDSRVRFASHGNGFSLFLSGTEAVLALDANGNFGSDLLRMQLTGSNPEATIAGEQPLPGTANYFLGNDPAQWHTGVPTYRRVRYTGLYPGIDLVYYGNQRQLEYDFIVAPGSDPKQIRLHFAGAKNLRVDADGSLVITAKNGDIAFQKPAIYQDENGQRKAIEGRFALFANHSASFRLGSYDRSRPLVIDPVLSYSTYLGGTGGDWASGIAVDKGGNAYITGWTSSTDFPVSSGALQTTIAQQPGIDYRYTVFVTKLNSSGTAIEYSTYLGGSVGNNIGLGIAVDSYGDAYVTGYTSSYAFPTTAGAFQTLNHPSGNAFVSKLNATGTALVYSTLIGGNGLWSGDQGNAITVDSLGDAYITGSTGSTNFPVSNGAFQSTNHSRVSNAFVTEINPTGTGLVYSTFLGGSGSAYIGNFGTNFPSLLPLIDLALQSSGGLPFSFGDSGYGIAVDNSGSAYVAGLAPSLDFPVTAGAFQSKNQNTTGSPFVTKVNPTGTGLVYSTFVGGSGTGFAWPELANAVAVDGSGNAYVAGVTGSTSFPVTAGAFQTSPGAANNYEGYDGVVFKLNPAGTALIYSTYLGGAVDGSQEGTTANGVAVDSAGDAYIGGSTSSAAFPVTPGAIETTNEGQLIQGGYNGFVTEIDPTGSVLLYSTFLGGTSSSPFAGDSVNGLARDGNGGIYVTGYANSQDFPVTASAYQAKNKGAQVTAFVTKLNFGAAIAPTITWPTASAITYGQTLASSVLTGGSASVPGTFAFTTPSTAPHAGTTPESVTFTSSDSAEYMAVTATLLVQVNRATPTVYSWPATASAIPYGDTLNSSVLSGGGSASVAGAFAFTDPNFLFSPGTYTVGLTFTPTDTVDYLPVTSGTVQVKVYPLTPTVTSWPTASAITFGQTLASSVLSGGAAVNGPFALPGSFAFTFPSTVPKAGTAAESVTFTPTSADYATVTSTVLVKVNPATPTIIWPTPSAITQGTALSATQLDATATIPGTFTYIPGAGAVLSPGTQTLNVTFNPADAADYTTATASVTLVVNPAINFAPLPTPVVYGVPPIDLEATSVSGQRVHFRVLSGPGFVHYGSMLRITGAGTVVVAAYLEGGPSVTQTIVVDKATPTIRLESWPHSSDHYLDHDHHDVVTLKATLGGVGDTPTGKVTFFDGETSLGESWIHWDGEAVFTTGSLSAGTNSITARYDGDRNYVAVTSTPLSITIR